MSLVDMEPKGDWEELLKQYAAKYAGDLAEVQKSENSESDKNQKSDKKEQKKDKK